MSGIVSRINQGRYDSEQSLLNLRDNAINKCRVDVLDSVDQRLKKCHPKIYERFVGPLYERKRDKNSNVIVIIRRAYTEFTRIS